MEYAWDMTGKQMGIQCEYSFIYKWDMNGNQMGIQWEYIFIYI